jgi:type IV secretory pathway VirJ component
MSRPRSCVLFALITVLARAESGGIEAAATTRIQAAPFRTVALYKPAQIEPDSVVVLVSGNGGRAGLDRELAAQGVSRAGFNSLRYFWHLRAPEEAARDFARVLEHYHADWKRTRFILIGYSFGAAVATFIVNRLPAGCLFNC